MGQEDSFSQESQSLSLETLRKSIPPHLFNRSELRFLISVSYSLSLTLMTAYLAYSFLPLSPYFFPLWVLYAVINGTFATGLWVLGHECGHYAFSSISWKNDLLGFMLHTGLLVPYFSWQHSHFVHHSRTNHLTEGESHVPDTIETASGKNKMKIRDFIGPDAWAMKDIFLVFTVGWPTYLLFGFTGGPKRGFTSHFIVPNKLFPNDKLLKVMLSNIGIGIIMFFLYLWAQKTSFMEVMAVYIGPYLVMNMWLVGYTWLQHSDETIPHYDEQSWDWLKGALCTIDRAYPEYINALHFDIGSTHVLHHLFSALPHYNAREASGAIKTVLGVKYNYDSRNVWKSLWEVAKLGVVGRSGGKGTWKYITKYPFYEKNE